MSNPVITQFPMWSIVFGVVIGSVFGSFLNMAIYRLPRRISFLNPSKSFCPKCRHPLEAIDLVPLLSWMSTGGKCRYCKDPIHVRYFLVELLTSGLFSALWYQFLIADYKPVTCIFYMVEVAGLVAVIFIDWELYIIPDELNAFLLVVAIAYRLIDRSIIPGLEGALLGWGLLWGIALLGRIAFRKDAMGHGDIKMMRGIGMLLGMALVTVNLAMAVVLGLVFGLGIIAYTMIRPSAESVAEKGEPVEDLPPESIGSLFTHGAWYLLCMDVVALPFPKLYGLIGESIQEEEADDENWKPSLTTIPFGPYLAAGAIVCMLFADPIQSAIGIWWQSTAGAGPGKTAAHSIEEPIATETPSQSYAKAIALLGVERTCAPQIQASFSGLSPMISFRGC